MQVAAYAQQASSVSLNLRGFESFGQAIGYNGQAGEEGALANLTQGAITDIMDIQHGMQEQMLQATQAIGQALSDSSLTIEEQIGVFEEQVEQLFTQLLADMQAYVMQGDLAGMAGEIGSAKEAYFSLEATLTIEVKTVTVMQSEPMLPDLTLQALDEVAQADINAREKEELLALIGMIDEFVKSPAHDSLLRGVLALVPMLEQASPGGQMGQQFMSMREALEFYFDARVSMRSESKVQSDAGGFSAQSSFSYSMSMSYSQQSESYFQTEA